MSREGISLTSMWKWRSYERCLVSRWSCQGLQRSRARSRSLSWGAKGKADMGYGEQTGEERQPRQFHIGACRLQ